MRRTSTDRAWNTDRTLVIDADGIEVELPTEGSESVAWDAAIAALTAAAS